MPKRLKSTKKRERAAKVHPIPESTTADQPRALGTVTSAEDETTTEVELTKELKEATNNCFP